METRRTKIEILAGGGELDALKILFEGDYTQLEIDVALENAIAYSQIETAEYLCLLGANFANYDYQGVYMAIHNNELKGLQYAISKGVDINVGNGMFLNKSIATFLYNQNIQILKWLLENKADTKFLSQKSLKIIESLNIKDHF